jgi:PadR family transcriptional regulator AphA
MSLKHAILAMIDVDKGSGYDLAKRFDQSVGFFWPSTFQQVYRDLGKLEESGLVSTEQIEQTGKPDKKIYDITPSGLEELKRWLQTPAREMKIKDTFLIKLFGGHRISKQELLEDLARQRIQHKATLERYTLIAKGLKAQGEELFLKYFLPYQALDLGIRFEKTWLEWSDELKTTLESFDKEQL